MRHSPVPCRRGPLDRRRDTQSHARAATRRAGRPVPRASRRRWARPSLRPGGSLHRRRAWRAPQHANRAGARRRLSRRPRRRLSGARLHRRFSHPLDHPHRKHPSAASGVALLVRAALHRGREDQAEARAVGRALCPWRPVASRRSPSTSIRPAAIASAPPRPPRWPRRWPSRASTRRLVCCGDTNAFSWRRGRRALDDLLAPFAAFGASDPERRPTHYFAPPERADDPAPDRGRARQAGARHPAPLRRRLHQSPGRRARAGGHARVGSRLGLGPPSW